MKWTDITEIAIGLDEAHSDIDPTSIRFTDLMKWCMALEGFDDQEDRCGERILEAIQMCWIEEMD